MDFNYTQVGFKNDGKIKAVQITVYSNAGFSLDASVVVNYQIIILYKLLEFIIHG